MTNTDIQHIMDNSGYPNTRTQAILIFKILKLTPSIKRPQTGYDIRLLMLSDTKDKTNQLDLMLTEII